MAIAAKKVTTKSKEKSADGIQINYIKYGTEIIGTAGDDGIIGTDGNDRIYGNGGNDKIIAGKGNDTIDGGAGSNTIAFEAGDGNDTILRSTGHDKIYFHEAQNLQFSRNMNNQNLVINYGNGDSVTVDDFYNNNSIYNTYAELWADSYNNHSLKTIQNGSVTKTVKDTINQFGITITGTNSGEQIFGSKGSDTIYGGGGNDSIISYAGNDVLDGGEGNDNYVFYDYSYGDKTIINSIGNDKVTICDPSHGFDLRFSRDMSNTDLKLTYKPDISNNVTGSITLKNYYVPAGHSVKQITNNVTTKTVLETIDQWGIDITGTNGYDNIYGSKGNDTIYAGEGNDQITGGLGDDILDGGLGSDFYYFNTGSGNDTILNNTGYGKDAIIFYDQQDLSLSRSAANKDLVISYGNNDSITLKDYFASAYHAVKFVKNGENAQYQAIGDVVSEHEMTYNGTSGSDIFKAYLTESVRIVDAGGNDELRIAYDADAMAGVNVLFNVDNTGNNLGDICLMSNSQVADWAAGNDFLGVKIENNAVENIRTGGLHITSSDISQLASDVAGWLSTNGFASVQAVLDTQDATSINALIAEFQSNTNWQPV